MRWLAPLLFLPLLAADQSIVEGPQEVSVNIGRTAVLRCTVENQKGSVQWMKNGFGLGVDRQLPFFPRYSMIGSAAKGEYHLQIVNVTVADDDVFACQVSEAHNEPSAISAPAKLTVLMRPSAPRILNRPQHNLQAIAGEKLTQSCISQKGKPPPKLGWALASDPEGKNIVAWLGETRAKFGQLFKSSGVSQESLAADIQENTQKDSHVFSVVSNVTFSPRPEDDKRYLICVSQHETFQDRAETDSLRLSLKYAPIVSLKLAAGSKVREGGPALLACDVDAKPLDNLKISWFKNGNEPMRHHTDTLAFEKLRMEDHNTEYTCQATNAIGTARATIKLDVDFAPRIMSTSQEKEVTAGDDATFRCDAVGNPPPQITWTKKGDDQLIYKGDTMTLHNVAGWQQGAYICTASVDGFPHTTKQHYLHVRGSPSVSVNDVAVGSIGDTVELTCRVSGRPKPPEMLWTKNGLPLSYISGRLQVHQVPRAYGIESKLRIQQLKESDLGEYNCTANNGLGVDSRTVQLRKRSLIDQMLDLDPVYLLPALALALFFLLCLCCCLCCRRRRFEKRKEKRLFDDQSDVTVKCEALDGQYFPEMYGSSPCDIGIMSKDYISIPQNNPDMDYLPPTSFTGHALYAKYLGPEYQHRFDGYGSFASGATSPALASESYPPERLAPLPEVDTPKASTYSFMVDRPLSRSSTHV